MKQFKIILGFELKNYFRNKIFVGVTVALIVILGIVMFFPRISGMFKGDSDGEAAENASAVMLLCTEDPEKGAEDTVAEETARTVFSRIFPSYDVRIEKDPETLKDSILSGNAEAGFVLHDRTSFTYFVKNLSLYDENMYAADAALQEVYRLQEMTENGLSPEKAAEILSVEITHETESLGKDQAQNFFYTYIMIFALYMVILLYGQMVATNVATEKSSRAMELLITSAKPASMMFGKVLASCIAGLTQLFLVFGSALLFFQLNRDSWGNNPIVNSIFNMPPLLLGYMLLFFVLGFFIYAFMFGAVGSTASKVEDINTSVMPITMLFIVAFLVVMFSMSSGNVDNLLMKVCSFIPFTSPMAMFTRIAMSTVPWHEIVLSIAILAASVLGIGFLAARIYRVGVLLYGTTPKIGSVLKAVRKA